MTVQPRTRTVKTGNPAKNALGSAKFPRGSPRPATKSNQWLRIWMESDGAPSAAGCKVGPAGRIWVFLDPSPLARQLPFHDSWISLDSLVVTHTFSMG